MISIIIIIALIILCVFFALLAKKLSTDNDNLWYEYVELMLKYTKLLKHPIVKKIVAKMKKVKGK